MLYSRIEEYVVQIIAFNYLYYVVQIIECKNVILNYFTFNYSFQNLLLHKLQMALQV